MTALPIVERELRVASRRPATHLLRVAAALVAMVVFGWMMLTWLQVVPSALHGRYLFRALFGFAFVYCLFVGARLTADCLSEEKREGTLGLLFLTDLKGYVVVLGKLAATSINSIYALLAIIPVMSVPVQLGGVTAADLWQSALVLLNTLFFSLASGVLVSALSRNERKAMFAAVFVVLFVTVGPFVLTFVLGTSFPRFFNAPQDVLPFLVPSPAYAFGYIINKSSAFTVFAPLPAGSFWWSALLVHLLSWLMLLWASRILPRIWQSRVSNSKLDRHRERVEQWAYGRAAARKAHRAWLLDINPFLWLVSRERWKPLYVWLYVGAVSGTWLWGWSKYSDVMFDRKTLDPTVFLFESFLKLWMISEACTRLAEDRRNGALELLLSTALTTRGILRGQWLAFRRQFAAPLAVVLLFEFILLRQQYPAGVVVTKLVMFVLDLLTLGWVGMWLGLTARNLNRAIVGAIGRVLILPLGIFYAAKFGLEISERWMGTIHFPFHISSESGMLFIRLANNFLFGLCWARRHLLQNFREAATQRYQAEKIGWLPGRSRRKDIVRMQAPVASS